MINSQAILVRFVLGLLGAALVLCSAAAWAGNAGRESGMVAGTIFVRGQTLNINTAYTIETLNLSPSTADSVLHIQNFDGTFLAGNDDCAVPGCTGFRSLVTIPAAQYARMITIVVRSKSILSGGTATLRITPSTGSYTDIPIVFYSGAVRSFATIPAGMHFVTAEEPRGASSTYMLVTSGTTANGISFASIGGGYNMAAIHMNQSCSTQCRVIVGTLAGSTSLTTTFVWDEDADVLDTDDDGLSNTLEGIVGTSAYSKDTDGDAIEDGEELYGLPNALLRMPAYGANPTQKDVFVEANWLECVINQGNGCNTNDDDPDWYRLFPQEAVDVSSKNYNPDVRVHIDNGFENTEVNQADWTKYGAWGGARRVSQFGDDLCDGRSPERIGYFHHGRINFDGKGQSPGACFGATNGQRHYSHEMGHNFYLGHGGHPLHAVNMNCKPNYKSIMSYAFLYDMATIPEPKFSRNEFAAAPLNPMAVDESDGLGTTDLTKLDHLGRRAFRYSVGPNGEVDWNRDGHPDTGFERAAVTWGWGNYGCQHSFYGANHKVTPDRHYTALSHFSWPGVIGGGQDRLYWFTRRESDGRIEYRYATSFPAQCSLPAPEAGCLSNWYPAASANATLLSTSVGGDSAPAASWFTDSTGAQRLVLVYKDTANHLRYQTMTAVSSIFGGYRESWTAPGYVGSGTQVIAGDPSVLAMDGQVWVFAILSGSNVLQAWSLSSTLAWSGPAAQTWADTGTNIVAKYGVASARGYVRYSSGNTDSMVAAIPLANPDGQVELAFRNKHPVVNLWLNTWSRLPAASWQTGQPVTLHQPGLAYEPFDRNADITDGRFYLAWFPQPGPNVGCAAVMTETEGSRRDGSTYRRLVFTQDPVLLGDGWTCGSHNISLLYDLEKDANVRAALTYDGEVAGVPQRSLFFFPFADGIYDATLGDQDDYSYIRSNLTCSLGQGACY